MPPDSGNFIENFMNFKDLLATNMPASPFSGSKCFNSEQ